MMRDSAQIPRSAVIEVVPHHLACADSHGLLAKPELIDKMLLQLPPLGIAMRPIHGPLRLRVSLGLIQKVCDPGGDRLDQDLRGFSLEELEHVEVAIAPGGL